MEGKRQPRDLTDPVCLNWADTVSNFGQPEQISGVVIQEIDTKEKAGQKIEIGRQRTKTEQTLSFDTPQNIALLNQQKFDPLDFIRTTEFAAHPLLHLKNACKANEDPIDDFNKSPIQKIADQLHNYVEATEDLAKANSLFSTNSFPGEQLLAQLDAEFDRINANMNLFFKGIYEQNQKAYEANKELSRIGQNGFIFTLADEIVKLQFLGQFDEIIRVYEKRKKLPDLEKVMPFSLAIQDVEKALRGVEDALRNKIMQMTPKTFNEKYCILLMGINPQKNAITQLIIELQQRILNAFTNQPITNACGVFETTYPFFKTLIDFFHDNYFDQYKTARFSIESQIAQLVKEISDKSTESLKDIAGKSEFTKFNEELHQTILRISQMYNIALKSKFMPDTIKQAQLDLQNWYLEFLKQSFKEILKSQEYVKGIVEYQIRVLDEGELFTPEQYSTLVSEPIFMLLDVTHEEIAMNGKGNIVQTLAMLNELEDKLFTDLFQKYQNVTKTPFSDKESRKIFLITDEIIEILRAKLVRQFASDISSKIYQGFFLSCIDWQKDDIPFQADGWLVYLLNKVISCRTTWGNVYEEVREDLIAAITSSILYSLKQLPVISKAGRKRLLLDLCIIEDAFWMEPLIPIPDPTDPSHQRTIDPPFGALGKKPELAYDPIEAEIGAKDSDVKTMRQNNTYLALKKQLNLQLRSLVNKSH